MRGTLAATVIVLAIASCTDRVPKASPTSPSPSVSGDVTILDTTWVDEDQGWVLASRPCQETACLSVAATSDGGRTWRMSRPPGGPPTTRLKEECREPCVSNLRFATDRTAFGFGPAFYESYDGGRSWRNMSEGPVYNVEIASRRVYRVISRMSGCPGPCDVRLQVTKRGETIWRTILRPRRDASRTGLVAEGSRIYFAEYGNPAGGAGDAHTSFWRSVDGGTSWRSFADPCGDGPEGENDAVSYAAGPSGFLAVLCRSRMASLAFARTSSDSGRTFGSRRLLPNGAAQTIAVGSSKTLLVTNIRGASFQALVSRDGGRTFRATLSTPIREGDAGVWLAAFQNERTARVTFGGSSIWTTRDAGTSWTRSDPF